MPVKEATQLLLNLEQSRPFSTPSAHIRDKHFDRPQTFMFTVCTFESSRSVVESTTLKFNKNQIQKFSEEL